MIPARAISTKNKHLLVIYKIPTRGFTAAVSVFRGTPPPKPLNCKSVLISFGGPDGRGGAHPAGGQLSLSGAFFVLARSDITWMSLVYVSRLVSL